MVSGGGSDFPDVNSRFDVRPTHLFGPFWRLQVIDTATGQDIRPSGGVFLTGYGSVRRAAKYSTRLYLDRLRRHDSHS